MDFRGISSPADSSPIPSSTGNGIKTRFDFTRHPGRVYLGDEYVNIQGKSSIERREALKILSAAVHNKTLNPQKKEKAPLLFQDARATRHSYVGYRRNPPDVGRHIPYGRLGTFIENPDYISSLNPVPSDAEIGFNPEAKFPDRKIIERQDDFEVFAREVETAVQEHSTFVRLRTEQGINQVDKFPKFFEEIKSTHPQFKKYSDFTQFDRRVQSYPAALFDADQQRYDLAQKKLRNIQ